MVKRLKEYKTTLPLFTVAFDGIAFQSGYALLPGNAIEQGIPTLLNSTSKNKYMYNLS
jgi:hypothetical protein